MNSDRLYELAFEYKATKLWKVLWDTELFAVKLPDGNIGYISIMGAAGEHCALALYIGEEGMNSYYAILEADRMRMSPFVFQELLMQQNCLQCAFVCKSELSGEEYEEAKSYARKHGIRLSGKNAYPQFVKYQANRCPWELQTRKEEEDLCEALAAAIEIARRLEGKMPGQLGLRSISGTMEIPLLERRDGAYVIGRTVIPGYKEKEVPRPKASNDIAITKLRKARKSGVLECGLIRFFQPVQDDPEEVPVFPVILLAVEASVEHMLSVPPVTHYEENPEELLDYFIDAMVAQNICPIKIKAQDERTYAFAEDLCRRLKIALSIETDLPALEDAKDDFLNLFGTDDEEDRSKFLDMVETLLDLDDEQLNTLPAEIIEQLEYLVQEGLVPKEMTKRLEQIFGFREDREREMSLFDGADGRKPGGKAKGVRKVESMDDIRDAGKRKKGEGAAGGKGEDTEGKRGADMPGKKAGNRAGKGSGNKEER